MYPGASHPVQMQQKHADKKLVVKNQRQEGDQHEGGRLWISW